MDPPGAQLDVNYVDTTRDIHCESRVTRSAEAGPREQQVASIPRGGSGNSTTQPEPQSRKPPPPSSLPRFKDQAMGQSERSVFPVAVVPEEIPAPSTNRNSTVHSPRQTNNDLPRFKDQAMSTLGQPPQTEMVSAISAVPIDVYTHNNAHLRHLSGLSGPTFKDQFRESAAATPMLSSQHIQAMTEVPTTRPQNTMTQEAFIALQNEGFPSGLIQQLDALKHVYAARFWIVDNSGSMLQPDCVRFVKSTQRVVECSRWDELCRTIVKHAELAAQIQAPTYFRWLNDPGARLGPAEICINDAEDVKILSRTMEAIQPEGRTPLTQHIQALEARIRNADYDAAGKKAVVVIATDGLPTDARGLSTADCKTEFVQSLRRLGQLPVWIVIRLCTNDDDVIQYYRMLDGQLEFEIEVIDDFVNEAKQVERFNGWLGYGHPLHLCREMGFHMRLFDLFNERSFTLDEIEELAKILFGESQITHSVHQDYKQFCLDITNSIAPPIVCSIKLKKRPWIDLRKLKREGSVFGVFRERMSSVLSMGSQVVNNFGN